ncbi:MAG: Holliday junction resolvase RuvX [Campylobacteraceae bacterium]|nr:Holliday junction resolvase RuvX [Campylobacteraceae bacterium]
MPSRIVALDIGLKRIGVALAIGETVIPQIAILRQNRNQAAKEVRLLLAEWDAEVVAVGLPKGGADADSMERRIKHFMALVGYEKKICFIDEYGTSLEAKERMRGLARQKKDGKIDSLAAAIILERYLSQNRSK